jgi:anion-transporting  ArsA/GET3 family ATPase
VGPIARQAGRIAATIADPKFTAVIAVSTAEEMPVNETVALQDALGEDGLMLHAVVVTALYPPRFGNGEVPRLTQAISRAASTVERGALRAAISEQSRAETQRRQLQRLLDELEAPLVELPYLFVEELGLPQLERLSDELEAGLA